MEYKISPATMCMDLMHLGDQIQILDQYVEMYHIDFIDGVYLRNFSFTPPFIQAMREATKHTLDVHMMVQDPFAFLDMVVDAGADIVSLHSEKLVNHAFRTARYLHDRGRKFGVVITPETSVETLLPYISEIDKITVMTVDPGFVGGDFVEYSLEIIRQLKELKAKNGYRYLIEADGQCNAAHFGMLKQAGIEVFIVGKSGLFSLDEDLDKAYAKMMDTICNA